MRPCALRPPRPWSGRTSDFSGVDRVISAKSETLEPRRPGVVGLYLRIAMSLLVLYISSSPARLRDRASEDLDGLAVGRDRHERALGVLALAVAEPGPLALALTVGGVDAGHSHAEDLLDGNLDLRLVRVRVHQEGVGAFLDQSVGLLGDDRGEQDVAGIGDGAHLLSSFCAASAGPWMNALSASTLNTTS